MEHETAYIQIAIYIKQLFAIAFVLKSYLYMLFHVPLLVCLLQLTNSKILFRTNV